MHNSSYRHCHTSEVGSALGNMFCRRHVVCELSRKRLAFLATILTSIAIILWIYFTMVNLSLIRSISFNEVSEG